MEFVPEFACSAQLPRLSLVRVSRPDFRILAYHVPTFACLSITSRFSHLCKSCPNFRFFDFHVPTFTCFLICPGIRMFRYSLRFTSQLSRVCIQNILCPVFRMFFFPCTDFRIFWTCPVLNMRVPGHDFFYRIFVLKFGCCLFRVPTFACSSFAPPTHANFGTRTPTQESYNPTQTFCSHFRIFIHFTTRLSHVGALFSQHANIGT